MTGNRNFRVAHIGKEPPFLHLFLCGPARIFGALVYTEVYL